jgi:hypothetical protein
VALLNAEVSSLRFILKSASDPAHPVGQFCDHLRQARASQLGVGAAEGIRPGLDVLPSTTHIHDPQAFKRFFSRAALAIASALEGAKAPNLANQLRSLVDRLSHPGLRSSQLRDLAKEAQALGPEVQQTLLDHPLRGASQRVFEAAGRADFLALENLMTTELLDAAHALASHDQVDLPHEMLQIGRRLASQSDIALKDLSQSAAVIKLILPQFTHAQAWL